MTESIMHTWQKGYIIDVQYLRGNGGLRYVTNYITKSLDTYKTFCLMSRRPGLGIAYVEKHSSYHRSDYKPINIKDDDFRRRLVTSDFYFSFEKRLDFFVSRKFFVLSMSNINPSAPIKPSLPRYFRDKIFTKLERDLLFERYKNDATDMLSGLSKQDRRNRQTQFEERERLAKDRYLSSLSKHGGSSLYAMHCREEIERRERQSRCTDFGNGFNQAQYFEWLR